ncbi:monothiol glutaredoxin-S2-like protein [Tanacetum coccineum]
MEICIRAHDFDLKEKKRKENKSENIRKSSGWNKIDLIYSRTIREPAEKCTTQYEASIVAKLAECVLTEQHNIFHGAPKDIQICTSIFACKTFQSTLLSNLVPVTFLLRFWRPSMPNYPIVAMATVSRLVTDKALVIFSKSSCCICHSVRTLICSFGANPTVYELDEHPEGQKIEKELKALGCKPSVPAVFIGQELVGGANEIMSMHLKGKLVPLLIKERAIWL